MERLGERLKRSAADDRLRRLLLLAPGCMFGFPPENLDRLVQRIDCVHCAPLMDHAERLSEIAVAIEPRIIGFRKPFVDENERRRARRDRLRRLPLIGRFFPRVEDMPVPSHVDEPWFAEMRKASEEMCRLIGSADGVCPEHWTGDEAREISLRTVAALAGSGNIWSVDD